MNRLAIYKEVWAHLLDQGRPSVNESGACVYRGPEGLKCGIGVLIKDSAFDPTYNDARLPEIPVLAMLKESGVEIDLGWDQLLEGGDDVDFLLRLQAAHDEANPGELWVKEVTAALDEIARDFDLTGSKTA